MPIVTVNGLSDSMTPVGVSQLGTVIFDNIVFPAGQWIDDENNPQPYGEVKLDAVTLSVNRIKKIIKSQVVGQSGDTKEYVTTGDYVINVNAIIAPDTFALIDFAAIGVANAIPSTQVVNGAIGVTVPQEPVQLLKNIADIEKCPDSVPIRCKYLKNNYDITRVVIESMTINRSGADTWTLQFKLLSDFELDLKDFG